MKKIQLLTTHHSNNYGALLQCYALSRFLNNMPDVQCKALQYFHPTALNSWKLFRNPANFRSFLREVYMLLRVDLTRRKLKKNKLMQAFRHDYLPLTVEEFYSQEALAANPPKADIYICGSDQIWNRRLKNLATPTYFLSFAPEGAKRIAYAPSISDPWSEVDCEEIKPYLQKFDAISLRESVNIEQVQSLVEKTVHHVCDPVFLLSPEEWDEIAIKPDIKEPYLFCYFLSVSDLAVKTVKKLREVTGLKIVHLNINAFDKFNSDINVRVAGPREFVGLIANASYVCTNSFHCTAFSLLYKKHITSVPQAHIERLQSLKETFKLDNLLSSVERISQMNKENILSDYSKGQQQAEQFINNSKSFLYHAINE